MNDDMISSKWQIKRTMERPTACPRTSWRIPIGDNAHMLVTNEHHGDLIDQWMVFEQLEERVEGVLRTRLNFVGNEDFQTMALERARHYAKIVHGYDIHPDAFPF